MNHEVLEHYPADCNYFWVRVHLGMRYLTATFMGFTFLFLVYMYRNMYLCSTNTLYEHTYDYLSELRIQIKTCDFQ